MPTFSLIFKRFKNRRERDSNGEKEQIEGVFLKLRERVRERERDIEKDGESISVCGCVWVWVCVDGFVGVVFLSSVLIQVFNINFVSKSFEVKLNRI